MQENRTSPVYEDPDIREDIGDEHSVEVGQRGLGIGIYRMGESWIKLHRKLISHWIWQKDPEYLKIWTWILLHANWKPNKVNQGDNFIVVDRGELICGLQQIANECRVGVGFVRKFLKLAEKDNMIVVKSNTLGTRITVCNYKELQSIGNETEQTTNTRRTHGEHTPNNSIIKKERKKERIEEERSNTLALTSIEVAAELPQNDGNVFAISIDQAERWQKLYPSVNVQVELCKIIGWLEANPTKRKTARGMMRFVNGWLSREQDKGKISNTSQAKRTVGDRQGTIDHKTSQQQLQEERDAVLQYLIERDKTGTAQLAISDIRRLGDGSEGSSQPR